MSKPKTALEKMAPRLQSWAQQEGPGRRTVLVRVASSSDPEEARTAFEEAGARVESSGKGVQSVIVTPESLLRIAELPWVIAVEEPRELFPLMQPPGGTC